MSQLNILRIDASARGDTSVTRSLTDYLQAQVDTSTTSIVQRDLYIDTPSLVSDAWVGANFTAPDSRTEAQRAALAESDVLVDELHAADVLLLGAPVYNFGIPAALKTWIDMVARVHRTFRYSANGPVGLLENKRAVVVMSSGGTGLGSDIDFASGYLRHILGFMGITDVTFVDATKPTDESLAAARKQLSELATTLTPLAA